MRSSKVLEMLNQGRIEELKMLLRDEIYAETLKTKPGAKKRYSAMRKYFTYHKPTREVLQKPCIVEYEGKEYTSFCDSWSLVLTTESTGEIELYNGPDNYPDVCRLLRFDGLKKKIDFKKVFADAKSKGFRMTKSEVIHKYRYLMHYDGSYYKIGLLQAAYGIIDNGEEAITYHPDGKRMPLTINNDIGICMIMPVNIKNESIIDMNNLIIIEVE